MKSRKGILGVAAALVIAACTTTSDSSSSWSRSYVAQRERVIEAAIGVLEDENYLVDVKKDGNRIDAEPSRSSGPGRATLVVGIGEKNGRILVDVQTRAGSEPTGRLGSSAEKQVLEFLHALDVKLKL
jgi:hypothetical protein